MENRKTIVRVSASFEQDKELFNWLKKYATHSDEHFAYWDEFAFTTEDLPECDGILILNTPLHKITTTCFPENVIAFMMEPGILGHGSITMDTGHYILTELTISARTTQLYGTILILR